MTIETKYNIGDEVYWKTKHYNGIGIIKNIEVSVSDIGKRETYKVFIMQEKIHLTFYEHDLYPAKEELLKSLQDENN